MMMMMIIMVISRAKKNVGGIEDSTDDSDHA